MQRQGFVGGSAEFRIRVTGGVLLVAHLLHAHDRDPDGGSSAHSIDRALEILAGAPERFRGLVTHEFALEDHPEALRVAFARGEERAIKVVFRPGAARR